MPMSAKITGLPETEAAMAELRQMVRTTATRKAVHVGAVVIRDEMRRRAPVLNQKTAKSTSLDPGALKADIGIVTGRVDKEGFITAAIGPRGNTAHVDCWVEFGHRLVKGGQIPYGRS